MPKPIVLDNTVLTNLALVGQMELVFRLWDKRVCCTPAVMDEYQHAVARGLLPLDAWIDLPVLTLEPAETTFATALSTRLGIVLSVEGL